MTSSDKETETVDQSSDGDEGQAIVAFIDGRFFHRGVKYGEDAYSEVVAIHKFDGPVCRVKRNIGLTVKLADFESARVDVGIEVPAYMEDAVLADEFAKQWCADRLVQEVTKIRRPLTPSMRGIITAMREGISDDDGEDGGY